MRDSLVRVDADVDVGCKDGRDGHGRAKVRERVDALAVPRERGAERPHAERHKVHDRGLVQAVEHVQPELGPGVLEPPDPADVQLREGERGFGVDVLVEGYKGRASASASTRACTCERRAADLRGR